MEQKLYKLKMKILKDLSINDNLKKELANEILQIEKELAINYTRCCKSDSEQLVLFSRFMSNNSKKAAYMTSTELLEEFKKQK